MPAIFVGSRLSPIVRARSIRALCTFNGIPFDRAAELERHIATLFGQEQALEMYKTTMRRVMFNVASNPQLNYVSARALAFLSDEALACGSIVERVQHQERQRHEALINMLREKEHAVAISAQDSALRCRCGSAALQFVQVQLRSADEGMSVFVSCDQCHRRWRMS